MGLLTDSAVLPPVPGSNRTIREACAALPPAEAAVLRRTPYDPTAVAPLRAKILGEVWPSADTESQPTGAEELLLREGDVSDGRSSNPSPTGVSDSNLSDRASRTERCMLRPQVVIFDLMLLHSASNVITDTPRHVLFSSKDDKRDSHASVCAPSAATCNPWCIACSIF